VPWKINGRSMVLYKWIFNYNFKWCKKFFNKGQAVQSTSCTTLNPSCISCCCILHHCCKDSQQISTCKVALLNDKLPERSHLLAFTNNVLFYNVTVPNWVGEPVWIHRGRVYSLFNGISVTVGISSRDVNQHLNQTIIKETIHRDVRWKN